jgi:16S rRNA (cytosine967-C5)-methyltransferase
MKPDPVRSRALDVLVSVDRGGNLDPLLNHVLDALPDARDRAFCAQLVRGTLQWRGRYDHLIKRFSRRRPPTDPGILNLLRLSLHQLLGQDGVPPYAAIHQAGELCRGLKGGARAVGFVNGFLQSVRREIVGDDPTDPGVVEGRLRRQFADLEKDPAAWCAAWHSHPRWLVDRWSRAWDAPTAEAICAHNNRSVPVVFHVLEPADPGEMADRLASRGLAVDTGPGPRALVVQRRPGRPELAETLRDLPELIVQDSTVQLATAWLLDGLAAVEGEAANRPALDLCAAPGGKTAALAARWPGPVVAMDASGPRLPLLAETMARLERPAVGVVQADGNRPPVSPESVGAVLLDGPCSGTGVLRHHPDGRWRLRQGVIAERAGGLKSLAASAADLLAPGGLLMYGTCSLEPEENSGVVESLLSGRADLEPAPDEAGRWHRLWLPHEAGGDGFFAARLRRRLDA